MAHLKRLAAPRTWGIKRKEKTFVTKQFPRSKLEYSMPLSLIVRDLLKQANNFREVRRILNSRSILINGKIRIEPKFPVSLLDIIEIPKLGKVFRLTFNKRGKFILEDLKKINHRLCRIENKTIVKNNRVQLNLFDGANVLIDKNEYKIGDVVKLNLKDNKISGKIELKENAKVFVIKGSHIGETAKIKKLESEKIPKEVILTGSKDTEFRTRLKNVYLVE